MYNNVRDYIVKSDRIGSLLKENKINKKSDAPETYLIRIRTKWPRHAICANTTVMQFHEMGIALKAHQQEWNKFALPQHNHFWPAYSSLKKLLSPADSKIDQETCNKIKTITTLGKYT